jgi:hypothetical protein
MVKIAGNRLRLYLQKLKLILKKLKNPPSKKVDLKSPIRGQSRAFVVIPNLIDHPDTC